MISNTGFTGSYSTHYRSTHYCKRYRYNVTMKEVRIWYWEWINNLSINFVSRKLIIIYSRKRRSEKEKDFG